MTEEYIKKEDVLKIIYDIKENKDIPKNYGTLLDIIRQIRKLPSEDVNEAKYGYIIETIKNGKMNRVFSCCDTDFTQLTTTILPDYCPKCGAKIVSLIKKY